MGIFREIPPTAGFPLRAKDLLSILSGKEHRQGLEDDFRRYLNVRYARTAYSGTAALYLILESLKGLSTKKTVIIPSFICPLVPLAIKRAGLRVEVCDISRDNFGFDASILDALCHASDDILAIVTVHLAGLPVDFDEIEVIARKYGVFTIEDCAQSFGALYKGKQVGTLGDLSFFSLCRGKGMTTYEGGIIVTDKEDYVRLIESSIDRLITADYISEAGLLLKLSGYAIFYRPSLFWTVFRLPQLFWNWRGDKVKAAMEDFDLDFPVHRMSYGRQRIGHSQFSRVDLEIAKQRRKAHAYIEAITGIEGLSAMTEAPDCTATYPYVTLIFDEPSKRGRALQLLERSGHGGSFAYALAIADYPYLKDVVPERNCSNARYLSERTITLSTSTFLRDEDIHSVAGLLRGL